jgi:diketogulonate reductase-like aldo/keto reductase
MRHLARITLRSTLCGARLPRPSLAKLGHIDLVLLHAPGDPLLRADTWRGLEACLAEGLVANVGVSNFGIMHLQKLAQSATTPPAVNQIEVHPFLQRAELAAYCATQGIVVEVRSQCAHACWSTQHPLGIEPAANAAPAQAYSPLAKAHVLDDPTLGGVARELGVTPAQVMLRWSVQKGFVTLPKSVDPARQAQNFDVFSFALSEAHMKTLDGLERGLITGWDPVTQDAV